MLTVNKARLVVIEDGRKLVGATSDLKIGPGRWPDFIAVVDDAGAGILFGPSREPVFASEGNHHGQRELLSMVYRSTGSPVELHILDD